MTLCCATQRELHCLSSRAMRPIGGLLPRTVGVCVPLFTAVWGISCQQSAQAISPGAMLVSDESSHGLLAHPHAAHSIPARGMHVHLSQASQQCLCLNLESVPTHSLNPHYSWPLPPCLPAPNPAGGL